MDLSCLTRLYRIAALRGLHEKDRPIGIHFSLSSGESQRYRPVYQALKLSDLVDEDGYFHRDVSLIEQHADPEEVRRELEAQIQLALSFGIDLTHMDSQGDTLMGLAGGREFLETVFDLCEKYRLPFNLPTRIVEQSFLTTAMKRMFQARIVAEDVRGHLMRERIQLVSWKEIRDLQRNQL
ncbi:ChbG/HpnK family deacetylase [Paenibacillus lignilyticus]|uniref:ChbG/HpnK family deacetylase n=1 Tax=Paenibacillus lignilyticus TaxID=1172615 RepID=A0ABS5CEJ6_9BACL|nr:ChbG/HpnK family deacetylase [Paenibacillus lignilyticus]MBP3963875.1 ChbG/HpnK family deacetylase [Paenibacillus lignilyticus]